MMCISCLSAWSVSFLLLLSGDTLRIHTNATNMTCSICNNWHPPVPCYSVCYENELGCSSHESHSSSKNLQSGVFINSVARKEITYSNVTCFLVGKLFFKFANFDIETSVELLIFLCFFVGVSSSKYLPEAVCVKDIYKLIDSTLCNPLSDNSPHIGHCTKASTVTEPDLPYGS